jgi:RNA polymerase sigma-70 factor, ECF subfamily
LIGDFDLAEEAAQEAFAAVVNQWESSGIPDLVAIAMADSPIGDK